MSILVDIRAEVERIIDSKGERMEVILDSFASRLEAIEETLRAFSNDSGSSEPTAIRAKKDPSTSSLPKRRGRPPSNLTPEQKKEKDRIYKREYAAKRAAEKKAAQETSTVETLQIQPMSVSAGYYGPELTQVPEISTDL